MGDWLDRKGIPSLIEKYVEKGDVNRQLFYLYAVAVKTVTDKLEKDELHALQTIVDLQPVLLKKTNLDERKTLVEWIEKSGYFDEKALQFIKFNIVEAEEIELKLKQLMKASGMMSKMVDGLVAVGSLIKSLGGDKDDSKGVKHKDKTD